MKSSDWEERNKSSVSRNLVGHLQIVPKLGDLAKLADHVTATINGKSRLPNVGVQRTLTRKFVHTSSY